MRTFVALELPEKVKVEIGKSQQDLKKAGVQARWVQPKIAHLTLAFLGSITPDKVKPIGEIMSEAAHQISPAAFYLNKIGCFPDPNKARIIHLELGGDLDKLNLLVTKIRKGLKKQKIWFDEKPFRPHLTLGRIRKRRNLTSIIKGAKVKKSEFIGQKISLYQSSLTTTGPVYSELKQISLT